MSKEGMPIVNVLTVILMFISFCPYSMSRSCVSVCLYHGGTGKAWRWRDGGGEQNL